jgi:transposase
VFGLGAATRIYLAPGATDLRKGFDGLHGLVRDRLLCDPMSGHVFLFTNTQKNRLKLLFADSSGLWVCTKRLEKSRFHWPEAGAAQGKIVLSQEEFAMLLGGIDLAKTRRRRWYRNAVVEESSNSRIPA